MFKRGLMFLYCIIVIDVHGAFFASVVFCLVLLQADSIMMGMRVIIMILLDVPGTSFARSAFFLVLLQDIESSLQAADSLAYTPLQRATPVSLFA